MATLSISNITASSCQWQISGLGYDWNSGNYSSAYITITGVGASAPVYPPTSGTSRSTSVGGFGGLTGGTTYTASAYAVNSTGTWSAGTATFTTSLSRPSNWWWTSSVYSGADFKISTYEWDSFTSRINEFRRYKSLSDYPFTTSFYTGQGFPYYAFNQAVNAISVMNPSVSPPSLVVSKDTIYASMFDGLRNSLNSI